MTEKDGDLKISRKKARRVNVRELNKRDEEKENDDNSTKTDVPGCEEPSKTTSETLLDPTDDYTIPGLVDEDDPGSLFSDLEVEYLEDDEDLFNEENKNKLSEKLPEDKPTLPKDKSILPKVKTKSKTSKLGTEKSISIKPPQNVYGIPKEHSRIPRDYSKSTKRSILQQSIEQAGIGMDDGNDTNPESKVFYIDVKELRKVTCAICLSLGRKMYSTQQNDNLRTLQQFCERPFTSEHSICWECNATLSKFREFRRRVMDAQAHFDNDQLLDTPTLSRLEISATTQVAITDEKQNGGDSNLDEIIHNDVELANDIELETTKPVKPVPKNPKFSYYCILSKQKPVYNLMDDVPPVEKKPNPPKRLRHYTKSLFVEKTINGRTVITEKENSKLVCKTKALSEEELFQLRHESRNKHWKKREFKCDLCIENFFSQQMLDLHNVKHDATLGEFMCGVCEQRFAEQDACVKHNMEHYNAYKCMVCGMLSLRKEKMLYHYETNHYERRRACGHCGVVFKLYKDYKRHLRLEHNTNKVICDLCKNTFHSKETLIAHLKTHQPGRYTYIQCTQCEVQFKSAGLLLRHMREVHKVTDRELYCPACDHLSMTRGSFYCHLKSLKHIKAAKIPYEKVMRQCEDCGRFFTNIYQLKAHRKYFHVIEHCRCELCDKDFISKALLKLHMRASTRHMIDRQRNFICDQCGNGYFNQTALDRHKYSHNEFRCFPCDICSSSFRSPHMLYRHRRKVHRVGLMRWNKFFPKNDLFSQNIES